MAITDFVVKNMTSKIIKMLEVSKGNIENIINSLPNAIAIIKSDGTIFSGNNKLIRFALSPLKEIISVNLSPIIRLFPRLIEYFSAALKSIPGFGFLNKDFLFKNCSSPLG